MTIDDCHIDKLEEMLEEEKVKYSNLTSELEQSQTCLKQQNDINAQLNLQIKEKESVIEILRSSTRRSTICEKDTSNSIADDVFDEEKPESYHENSEFLKIMTEKVCPSDLNEEILNLKDDIVSELAESLPKIG